MITRKITFGILLCLLSFYGCVNPTKKEGNVASSMPTQELPVIDIDRDFDNEEEFRLSEIASDIEYIKLEKTPESIVGGGNPAWYVTKEYIFVYSMSRLLQFDRNGNFIKQIGRDGRGPGEIPVLKGLVLNEAGDILYVMGNWIHNMYKFDVNTGKFLGDFPINPNLGSAMLNTRGIQMIDNNKFIALSHNLSQFSSDYVLYEIFDDQGNVLARRSSPIHSVQKSSDYIWGSLPGATQMWTFEGNLRLYEDLNDTIYNIKNYQTVPAFVFDLGKYGGSVDNMATTWVDQSNSFVRLGGIWETPNFLFFNFYYKGELRIGRFDKTKNKFSKMVKKGEDQLIINDIDGGLPLWPGYTVNEDDREWVSFFDAFEMKKRLTDEWFQSSEAINPQKKEQLMEFVSNLSEDDNPIVIIVKLKPKEVI